MSENESSPWGWYLFGFFLWFLMFCVGARLVMDRHREERIGCQSLCGVRKFVKVSEGMCFCE